MVLWGKGWTKNVQRSLPAKIIHGSCGGHPTLSWGPVLTPWRLKGSRWRIPRTTTPSGTVDAHQHTYPYTAQDRPTMCHAPRWRSVTEELTCIWPSRDIFVTSLGLKPIRSFFLLHAEPAAIRGWELSESFSETPKSPGLRDAITASLHAQVKHHVAY